MISYCIFSGYRFRAAPDVTTKKKEKELAFEIYTSDETKRIYQVCL